LGLAACRLSNTGKAKPPLAKPGEDLFVGTYSQVHGANIKVVLIQRIHRIMLSRMLLVQRLMPDLSGHFYVFSLLNPDLPQRRFCGVLHIPFSQLNIPQLLAKLFLFMFQVVHFVTVQAARYSRRLF